MKYAVMAPTAAGTTANPDWIAEYARHVERCGFESLVVVEHSVVIRNYASAYPYDASGRMELDPGCDIPDPLDLIAFLAAHTSTLGLATGVLVLPNHHPVPLAKRLATIDALSQGRLRVCVGMGWMREELEACGVPFDERGKRADEQLEVLRKLWAGDDTGIDHDGDWFAFAGAVSYPKPFRSSGIPLHIGGHSKAAARRAGRYGDGLQPLGVRGEELAALVGTMRRAAEDAGRDPRMLELSLGHVADRISLDKTEALAEMGASRVVLATSAVADLERAKDELSACAERLELA